MSNIFPYAFGPKGRQISVDADGKIIATSENGGDAYVYGYGPTGRPLAVDASGRLIMSPLSSITATNATASGSSFEEPWKQIETTLPDRLQARNNLQRYKNALYIGTSSLVTSVSGSVYKITYDEATDTLSWSQAFLIDGAASGWPAVMQTYNNKLYIGSSTNTGSGWVWSWDDTNLSLIGAVSGYNADVINQPVNIYGMGEHDNKLIFTMDSSVFGAGENPVFYYDGSNFGELFREKTTEASSPESASPTSYQDKLYCFQGENSQLNIFDGIRNVYVSPGITKPYSGIVYHGSLYILGTSVLYKYNETDNTASEIFNLGAGGAFWKATIYNNKMYCIANSGGYNQVISYDGNRINLELQLWLDPFEGIESMNGRLFAVTQKSHIFTYKADSQGALSNGRIDSTSHSLSDNKQYIKNLLDYTGNNYQARDAAGALISNGQDAQRYPAYTSTRIVAQSDPLSSGVSKLDTKLGDQAIPSSGWDLPAGEYGDQFYHQESGYMRFGIGWEQQTFPVPHFAELWVDTTPTPGELVTLPTAESFVRFVTTAPSGGQVEGHGLDVHGSGILITDADATGHYNISYAVSFDGTSNTTIWGAIFINDTEQRCSKVVRKLSAAGDVGNMGSACILDVANIGDDINVRFAATANSKSINVQALNLTISRIHKH